MILDLVLDGLVEEDLFTEKKYILMSSSFVRHPYNSSMINQRSRENKHTRQ